MGNVIDRDKLYAIVPPFTWDELERELMRLAGNAEKRRMVPHLVSAVRKQSQRMASGDVLTEILALAYVMIDETFGPALPSEDDEA